MRRKSFRRVIWTLIIVFLIMNIVAFFHAYKFTHFSDSKVEKTHKPDNLSAAEKLKTLLFGVSNLRPANNAKPGKPYETVRLNSNKEIEGWLIKSSEATGAARGTVILFHGYGGEKSSLIKQLYLIV